jgi:hypothetical protein
MVLYYVGTEVLTAVVMKSSILWDITPCSPLKIKWCFGGICRLHLQDWRLSQARNQHEAGSKQGLLFLLFNPEDGGEIFLRNVGWFSTDYTALYIFVVLHPFSKILQQAMKLSKSLMNYFVTSKILQVQKDNSYSREVYCLQFVIIQCLRRWIF